MVGIRPLSLVFLMLALLVPASASANERRRIIVKRDPGLSAAEQRDIRADAGVTCSSGSRFPTGGGEPLRRDASDALHALDRDPDVVYAETDGSVPALADLPRSRHAAAPEHRAGRARGRPYDADIDAPEAWTQLSQRSARVTGGRGRQRRDADHEDLLGRVVDGLRLGSADGDADAPTHERPRHRTSPASSPRIARTTRARRRRAAAPRSLSLRALGRDGEGDLQHHRGLRLRRPATASAIVNASLGGIGPGRCTLEIQDDRERTLLRRRGRQRGTDVVGEDNDATPATRACRPSRDAPERRLRRGVTELDDARPASNFGARASTCSPPAS